MEELENKNQLQKNDINDKTYEIAGHVQQVQDDASTIKDLRSSINLQARQLEVFGDLQAENDELEADLARLNIEQATAENRKRTNTW